MAIPAPATVPARAGLMWARQGMDALAATPATWVGITLLFVLMGMALSVIPIAGMVWPVVVPVHLGGLMIGCRALRQGQRLEVRHLFSGFDGPHLRPLLLVGALYFAANVIIILPVIVLMIGSSLMSAVAMSSSGGSVAGLASVGVLGVIVVLVTMAAAVVLSLALWFAPALVVFDGVPALDALKSSLRAGWANIGALVVYGLVLTAVGLVVVAPLLGSIMLLAARGEGAWGPLHAVLLGGTGVFACFCIILVVPMGWGAMYASYEDVFGHGA